MLGRPRAPAGTEVTVAGERGAGLERMAGRLAARLGGRLLGLPPITHADVRIHRDLPVTMPDGVVLLADRWVPDASDASDAPRPVVLVRSSYGRARWVGLQYGRLFAARGLQVVVQSVRGTFGSGGAFRPFHQERSDGVATVAWLRAQPWCDGRVATMGSSYLGYVQWAVAPYVDPPLEALALAITASEMHRHGRGDGGFALLTTLDWVRLLDMQEGAPAAVLARLAGLGGDAVGRVIDRLPLGELDEALLGHPHPYWRDVVAHLDPDDPHWDAADHSARAAEVRAPVSMVTGWYDIFLPRQLRDVRALQEAGNPPHLVIGSGNHQSLETTRTTMRDHLAHLRGVLHDGRAPQQGRPVRLYLQQADEWQEHEAWPPPSRAVAWHLHPDGLLAQAPPPSSAPDRSLYDPVDPTPVTGGPILRAGGGRVEDTGLAARRDVLVWTSAPLAADLDVLGEVEAVVHLRSDPAHADVFVRLSDVGPDGRSHNVTDGLLRVRPGEPAADEDGVVAARVPLWPTGYRVRRGHRLRVLVAPAAFPRYARQTGTGEPASTAARLVPALRETFHDPAHPSRIVLPVVSVIPER